MTRSTVPVNVTPYTRHEVVGRGSYGVVYKGVHNETKATVAIKVLNLDTIEDEVADIQKEIVVLQSLKAADAQNVVRYHGSFLNGTRLWIIMDYCEGGSIRTLMKSGRIEERYITVIIRDVLAALSYIHKSDIIHRDLKAANILVTYDGRIQLSDFGVAAQLVANHFKRNTFVGTPYWMAPEVISEGLSYNFKADIWSLGITIYEIATGNPPYADQEPMRAIFLIPRSASPRLEGTNFSMNLKEFVSACLCERPEDRPTATELLKMKCIKNSSKVPTTILRELIVRYEAWRRSGGVRKSLAIGTDLDVDEEFDGQFGLDDDSGNGQDGWDFDTVRRSMIQDVKQPTWEQSADAAEDLLRTIKPGQQNSVYDKLKGAPAPPPISSVVGTSASSRFEHPLMKLFGDHNQTNGIDKSTISLPALDTSVQRSDMNRLNEFYHSEPSTPLPQAETISIEMPALNATSLTSAASAAPSSGTPQQANISQIQLPILGNMREHDMPRGTPSRQNSFDIFGGLGLRAATTNAVIPHAPVELPNNTEYGLPSTAQDVPQALSSSPPRQSFKQPSPVRSRPVSPTRLPIPSPLSPPASPFKPKPASHQYLPLNSAASTSAVPKNGFNASLGHLQLNNSTQSLPDILPRPSISGTSRERSTSSSAIPQLSKHIKRPSNLVLHLPQADSKDDAYLPPSPSRLPQPANAAATYMSTPLTQQVNAAPSIPPIDTQLAKRTQLRDLPPIASLDLAVLTNHDHSIVVDELSRVVGEMLQQLTHIEDGLTSMTNT